VEETLKSTLTSDTLETFDRWESRDQCQVQDIIIPTLSIDHNHVWYALQLYIIYGFLGTCSNYACSE
jgi:hypothetical protein